MVQTVTLELSALNAIPGVSGVEDVQFSVPEVSDLVAGVEDALPTGQDIRDILQDEIPDLLRDVDIFDGELDQALQPIIDELDDRLDDLVDDIQGEIDRAVADLDVPGLEDVEVEVGGSLFAVNEDFVDLLATALDQVDFLDVDQLGDVEGLIEDVEGFLEDVQPLVDSIADGLIDDLVNFLEAVEPLLDVTGPGLIDLVTEREATIRDGIPGTKLLFAPDQFIDDQLDRVTEGLVSEEARQELQEAIEED